MKRKYQSRSRKFHKARKREKKTNKENGTNPKRNKILTVFDSNLNGILFKKKKLQQKILTFRGARFIFRISLGLPDILTLNFRSFRTGLTGVIASRSGSPLISCNQGHSHEFAMKLLVYLRECCCLLCFNACCKSLSSAAFFDCAMMSSSELELNRAHSGSSRSDRKAVSVPVVPIRSTFAFKSIEHYKQNHCKISIKKYVYVLPDVFSAYLNRAACPWVALQGRKN